jgi:phosphoribosyl 1,2-cyclic phosphate phosphodiesterase
LVIDFGPDFRTQLLTNGIKKLDYVFLTHCHGDHMCGYIELARQKNLILEAPKEALDDLFLRLGNSREWMESRNPTMKMSPFNPKIIGGVNIETIKLRHDKDFDSRGSVPCYGYLFKSKKHTWAYMSDFNDVLEPEKLENLDLIISDGSGLDTNLGHLGIKGSIKLFNKFKPKKMIITHIRHIKSHEALSAYVRKFGNIEIAFDGMQLELD